MKYINSKCGIYCITNIVNNKKYIGYSKNSLGRWSTHISTLINNKHDNEHLQNSFNKYGKNNFVFTILEECLEPNLVEREHYWAILLNTHNRKNGYNIRPTSNTSTIKMSDETKFKISLANKGRIRSKEWILKLKDKWKEDYNLRVEKMKITHREKLGKSLIVLDLYNKKLYEFTSYAGAAEFLNLKSQSIAASICRKTTLKGYIFVKKDEYDPNKNYISEQMNIKKMRIKYAK